MNQKLSHKTLCGYLTLLREVVGSKQYYPPSHVLFFNSRSFYCYFSRYPCGKDTVGGVLKKMEKCIPLAFTTESIRLFLSAYDDTEDTAKIDSFMESSKADFLLLLSYSADDEERWHAVTELCEGLRVNNQ